MKTKKSIFGFIFLFSLIELHGINTGDGSKVTETITP